MELDRPHAIARAVEHLKVAEPSIEGHGEDDNAYCVACKARGHFGSLGYPHKAGHLMSRDMR